MDKKGNDGEPSRVRQARPPSSRSKLDIGYLLNSSGSGAGPSQQSYTPVDMNLEPPASQSSASIGSSSSRPHPKAPQKERPYECEICHFPFAQRSDRNKHVRTVHFRERPFSCQYCSQTFGEKGNLYVMKISYI